MSHCASPPRTDSHAARLEPSNKTIASEGGVCAEAGLTCFGAGSHSSVIAAWAFMRATRSALDSS